MIKLSHTFCFKLIFRVYKPLNFTISWYKYPFRDSYMNKYISKNEFKDILKKCEESFKMIKSSQ